LFKVLPGLGLGEGIIAWSITSYFAILII
jgi:hypothetical protein